MPMPKTTQDDEFSRVLENPDNFIVSEGFEGIFESLEDEPVENESITVSYGSKKISGELIKFKMRKENLSFTLRCAGTLPLEWLKDQMHIGSFCALTNNRDIELLGTLEEIKCKSITSDGATLTYTISFVKNT